MALNQGFQKGVKPTLAHNFAKQSVMCYTRSPGDAKNGLMQSVLWQQENGTGILALVFYERILRTVGGAITEPNWLYVASVDYARIPPQPYPLIPVLFLRLAELCV